IHIYTKARNARLLANRNTKECISMMTHLFHVSNTKKGSKAKRFKFINYQVPGIQKNTGKGRKQNIRRSVDLELPEWCPPTPIEDFMREDSLGLDMDFGLSFHLEDTAIPVFSDDYDFCNDFAL